MLLRQRSAELQDAQDNLARDEIIFAEKVKEVQGLKHRLEHEGEAHSAREKKLHQEVQRLQQELDRRQTAAGHRPESERVLCLPDCCAVWGITCCRSSGLNIKDCLQFGASQWIGI